MNENEIRLSKKIESMVKENAEQTSLTRKMIGNVEAAFTDKNTEQNEIINYNKRQIEKIKKVVVRFYNIMQLHGWGMSFPNLGELIESLKKPVIISRKAVENYVDEAMKKIQCPKCMNINNIEYKDNLYHCLNCGMLFPSKTIEDRTELQKEVEGLTFTQLAQKLSKADRFATYRDLFIYIDCPVIRADGLFDCTEQFRKDHQTGKQGTAYQ